MKNVVNLSGFIQPEEAFLCGSSVLKELDLTQYAANPDSEKAQPVSLQECIKNSPNLEKLFLQGNFILAQCSLIRNFSNRRDDSTSGVISQSESVESF